jgi:hypothetical protein
VAHRRHGAIPALDKEAILLTYEARLQEKAEEA